MHSLSLDGKCSNALIKLLEPSITWEDIGAEYNYLVYKGDELAITSIFLEFKLHSPKEYFFVQ